MSKGAVIPISPLASCETPVRTEEVGGHLSGLTWKEGLVHTDDLQNCSDAPHLFPCPYFRCLLPNVPHLTQYSSFSVCLKVQGSKRVNLARGQVGRGPHLRR